MGKVIKFLKIILPILFLSFFTIILRLYKLEELFYFSYDESIPAFVSKRLIEDNHIGLIGGVTPFGFHLTPYFYWFLAFILKLGNFDPIAWGYTSAFISVLTVITIFVIGNNFAGRKTAFIASSIWAFSYLANLYDRRLWALYWGPLIALLTIYSLSKIIAGKRKYIYVLTFVLILGFSADPSNLIFFGLTVVCFLVYKIKIKKDVFIALLIFLLSLLPLVVFDLRHNFANLRPVLNYSKQANIETNSFGKIASDNVLIFPRSFARLMYVFGDGEVSKQYSYCTNYIEEKFSKIPFALVLSAAFVLLWFLYKNLLKKDGKWNLIAATIALYFIGIQLFGTLFKSDVFEHYTSALLPLYALITGKLTKNLPRSVWLAVLALFIFLNLYKLNIAENKIGQGVKKQAINYVQQNTKSVDFSLEALSSCWRYSGFRYLFSAYGREPVKSYVDPNLAYLYRMPVAKIHPNTVAVFVVHDFNLETDNFYKKYALYKSHERQGKLFGNIEVILMDNSSKWFDKVN